VPGSIVPQEFPPILPVRVRRQNYAGRYNPHLGQIVSRRRDLKPRLTWETSKSGEHGGEAEHKECRAGGMCL
jgi:hypothetical protein